MPTKDSEMLQTIDDELKGIDIALVQVRHAQRGLESACDTLRYIKNVLTERKKEGANAASGH